MWGGVGAEVMLGYLAKSPQFETFWINFCAFLGGFVAAVQRFRRELRPRMPHHCPKVGLRVFETFNEFFGQHKDEVRLTTSPEQVRALYFSSERDALGFDRLPEFFKDWGVEWSVSFAKTFEAASGLRSRLEPLELATFRMIFDRHMVNLSQASFDQQYVDSSDERALFLIYHRIAPVRVCTAMAKVKSMTFDYVHNLAGGALKGDDFETLNALSTLFYIELNHIMRVYIYFNGARGGPTRFEVVCEGDDEIPTDYAPPTTNSQMAYPNNPEAGGIELF